MLERFLLRCGRSRFRFLRQPHDVLVRNFPTKVSVLASLFEVLLQENGAPCITDESSGGRQENIARAILDLHLEAEKNGITGHGRTVSGPVVTWSIVRKFRVPGLCISLIRKRKIWPRTNAQNLRSLLRLRVAR